jgi:hypothetical protein
MTDNSIAERSAQQAAVSEEHVRLARLLGGGQGRGKVSERCVYYRKPSRGAEAGWIVINGTNAERQQGLFAKGFVPLQQYGFVSPQDIALPYGARYEDEGQARSYRAWSTILLAPGGPEEFPVDQLIAYRWYDPEVCPVPTARFPQLVGVTITRVWCEECSTVYYHKPTHLARHLRTVHQYDRADVRAYGEQYGINFQRDMGDVKRGPETVAYEMPPEPEPDLSPLPPVEFEDSRQPRGRGGRRVIGDD